MRKYTRPGRRRHRPAFTVVELFVVVIIIAVVATGMSMFSSRGSSAAAGDAASRFLAAYQAARGDAIAQGRWALIAIRSDTAADRIAGRSAQYSAAVVTDPNINMALFAQASWTPVDEDVILDPGAATVSPLPGMAVGTGYSRSTFTCRTVCDMGGASAVTVYFRPSDDSTAVWSVLISQSGQARLYKYSPTAGATPWQ